MISDKIKELDALKQRATALENEIATERLAELSSLPQRYGFESLKDFIKALRRASSGNRSGKIRSSGKRTRAKITEETRASVKKLVSDGKTGVEIASSLKISLPSVQNIKKALGLIRKAKK